MLKSQTVRIPNTPKNIEFDFDTSILVPGFNDFLYGTLTVSSLERPAPNIIWSFNPQPSLENSGIIELRDQTTPCDLRSYDVWQIIPSTCMINGVVRYKLPYVLGDDKYDKKRYDSYQLNISIVSKDYITYLSNLAEQENYTTQIFVEPSISFTNMEVGLGIIGTSSDTTLVLFE